MAGLFTASVAGAATRTIQWNVAGWQVAFMYATMVAALAVFGFGCWRRIRVWRSGLPEYRFDQPLRRLRRVLVHALGHARLMRDRAGGVMHWLIFYGVAVLFAATVAVFVDHDLGVPILHGAFYLYFESLTVDIFGVFALVGVGAALWRHRVVPVPRVRPLKPHDDVLLVALLLILLTGYVLQGARIAATKDPWASWSPVALLVSHALSFLPETQLLLLHRIVWITHVALWQSVLAILPFTRLAHVVMAPINLYFGNLAAPGAPLAIDFGVDTPRLGIGTPTDLTWKQLMDLDACVECGRCQDACPAYAEGKPLSPKQVIVSVRDEVRTGTGRLLPDVVGDGALWACTTCRACEDACPVGIEHVRLILGLRQYRAMEQGEAPPGVQEAIASLEDREHPFRGADSDRTQWHEDLDLLELTQIERPEELEVLYWVGCAVVSNAHARDIARAFVHVLNAAGVRFAILGREERCCGDPARRTGNEFHFNLLASQNVRRLAEAGLRIVTHCPHCLQTLKNDYAHLGASLDVVHHSDFVDELIQAGRLAIRTLPTSVTLHDPCYLSRYDGQVDAARRVLRSLGVAQLEMERNREHSFCCGSGGGHAFYQDAGGGKINRNRAQQALDTNAEILCTACPFCAAMLEDGMQAASGSMQVRDFVELLADSIGE